MIHLMNLFFIHFVKFKSNEILQHFQKRSQQKQDIRRPRVTHILSNIICRRCASRRPKTFSLYITIQGLLIKTVYILSKSDNLSYFYKLKHLR